MRSKVVAILETRTGEHLAELIERRGAIALSAPALEEVPDVDPVAVAALVRGWPAAPYGVVIFQTGVGTRALFETTDSLGKSDELLAALSRALVVVRGPKPVGELNQRGVRIDLRAASPFTTETVMDVMSGVPLQDARVLVQRYGATNVRLREALQARGAAVDDIATYRWAVPADIEPLKRLLDALDGSQVDSVVFTSAVQMHNLYEVARTLGRSDSLAARLNATFVASIGPVCSRVLREYGITPDFEASPPKLGPLISGLSAALDALSL